MIIAKYLLAYIFKLGIGSLLGIAVRYIMEVGRDDCFETRSKYQN